MDDKVVIGLDSSTQSTKAIAWNSNGEALGEGRAPIAMQQPRPGYYEQDTNDWWRSACGALRDLCQQVDPARIAGIAISNQRETVGFLDPAGQPVRPAIVWLDERASDRIAPLNAAFPDAGLHRITGKPADVTPTVYRLDWLRENQPDVLQDSAAIVDVHGYLTGRLTGVMTAGWTSADPFGAFDINTLQWSRPILDHLGLSVAQFPATARPGTDLGTVTEDAARATGLPAGTPVYCAGGDGQCAGLGVNAIQKGRVYLNLGTAIVIGINSPVPALNHNWRTLISPTGEGYFLEGVLRGGAFFVDWFVRNFVSETLTRDVFDRLEQGAGEIALGSEGLTVCPYLSGCMNPHWNPDARAGFIGLGAHHTKFHLYRAVLESLTSEVARCVGAMRHAGHHTSEIVAVGGGANSALWSRMVADACGLPLIKSCTIEASSLGAGISAAVGAGWFDGFASAAAAMVRDGQAVLPDRNMKPGWDALSTRQEASYHATNNALSAGS